MLIPVPKVRTVHHTARVCSFVSAGWTAPILPHESMNCCGQCYYIPKPSFYAGFTGFIVPLFCLAISQLSTSLASGFGRQRFRSCPAFIPPPNQRLWRGTSRESVNFCRSRTLLARATFHYYGRVSQGTIARCRLH